MRSLSVPEGTAGARSLMETTADLVTPLGRSTLLCWAMFYADANTQRAPWNARNEWDLTRDSQSVRPSPGWRGVIAGFDRFRRIDELAMPHALLVFDVLLEQTSVIGPFAEPLAALVFAERYLHEVGGAPGDSSSQLRPSNPCDNPSRKWNARRRLRHHSCGESRLATGRSNGADDFGALLGRMQRVLGAEALGRRAPLCPGGSVESTSLN